MDEYFAFLNLYLVAAFLVLVAYRHEFRCNILSLIATSTMIVAVATVPIYPDLIKYLVEKTSFTPSFSPAWGVASYWIGLFACHKCLPGFRVKKWSDRLGLSTVAILFYFSAPAIYYTSGLLFLLWGWFGFFFTMFLLIGKSPGERTPYSRYTYRSRRSHFRHY